MLHVVVQSLAILKLFGNLTVTSCVNLRGVFAPKNGNNEHPYIVTIQMVNMKIMLTAWLMTVVVFSEELSYH